MFTIDDAFKAARMLNIKFDTFTIHDFLRGLNIELEHGTINELTNVTNDDLLLTSKIALAHLNEHPNYYNEVYGLSNFEKLLNYENKKRK